MEDESTRCGLGAEAVASRADLVRRAVAAGGAVLGGGALLAGLPQSGGSAPSPEQDARVFAFVLLVEELQAAFYAEALARRKLTGELRRFAEIVGAHERAHVRFLRGSLGAQARRRPTFDFGSATSREDEFMTAAVTLEDTGVAAYNGQAGNLTAQGLRAAARIVSVEARHAAWIRDIAGRSPAADATDPALSEQQVRAALDRTRFISSEPGG